MNQPSSSSVTSAERPTTARDYLGVSLFWLALSFFWGALLTIALPARIEALFGSGGKDSALSILSASGACVAGVTQIVSGALSDGSRSKFGRRRPYLFAGTLLAIGPLLLLPQAHTLVVLLLAYALLQLAINVAAGPYGALMHDIIPPRDHDTASAWIGVVGLIGRIGGPLVAVVLLGRGLSSIGATDVTRKAAQGQANFATLMGAFAVVLVIVMLVTMWLAREQPLVADGKPRASLGQRVLATVHVPLRPYPDFRWLIVSRFGIMMGIYTVSNFLLYYVRDTLGFSAEDSLGVLQKFLVLSTVAGLVGTLPSGALSKRIGRKRVLYGANTICMVAGLCFALAHNLTLAYVAATIFGVGFGAFAAVDWALATGLLPPDEPAKYMGVWGLSDTVSQVIAPLVAGPLALLLNRALGSGTGYRGLMLLALGWFLLGTLALRPIREKRV
jgi:MFS family permease